jgi:hypothetical protein
MAMTVSTVVNIACSCLFVVAPVIVIQKAKLRKLGTLRGQHNLLRLEVNAFSAQNERLKQQRVQLDSNVTSLKEVEAEYERLRGKMGSDADRMFTIVKQNGEIQAKIKKNLESQVMQEALDTVLKSDTDSDFSISEKEIPQLKLRLKNIPGIDFDEKNFDKLYKDRTGDLQLKDVMKMFRNLKDPNVPEKDNIFHYETKQLVPRSKSFLGF